ncbi:MAG: GNAT family N-acetyltransferase [Candidatus Moraniibacteriota bacterium]
MCGKVSPAKIDNGHLPTYKSPELFNIRSQHLKEDSVNTKELPACRIVRHLFPPAPHDEPVKRRLVRSMHPEAAQSWARLYDEWGLYPIGPQPYENLCTSESRHLFWAIEPNGKGRVLGMMFCTPIRLFDVRIGVIHDFIVAHQHQRHGIAGILLEATIAWTREEAYANGVPAIGLLQTAASRRLKSATSFLRKHGFRLLTQDDDPYYGLDITPRDSERLKRASR